MAYVNIIVWISCVHVCWDLCCQGFLALHVVTCPKCLVIQGLTCVC